jgi:Tfp pilus assembly protein PilF
LAALTAAYAAPSQAQWSPLSRDVQEEIGSSEKAPELQDFHKLRDQLTAEEIAAREAEKQQKKAKGLLGRFKRSKPAPAEQATEEAAPAEEEVSVPAGEEPGTAPAKELMESEAGNAEGDEENGEEEEAPKKAKEVPGAKPTEDTTDSNYFVKRAMSYLNSKDYQSALNYVDKALELQPQNWDAWYTKALTYQLAGYDAAAAKRYLKLLEHRPDMLEAHVGMGMLYRKHNNFDLAEKEYQDAIALKYYSFPAHYNLANLLMDQKKYEAALKEYKVCMKLQPNNALVHNNMGVIFQNRAYLEEAAQEFQKAANLEPANKLFVQNLDAVRQQLAKKGGSKTVTM